MEVIKSIKTAVLGKRMRYDIELESGRKIVAWDSDFNYESPKVGCKIDVKEGKVNLVHD